jgi:spermidine synthase
MFLSASLLLLPAMLMGMTFPVANTVIIEKNSVGGGIGKTFALNTAGGMFGSFMAGFVLMPFLGPEKTVCLAAAVNLLAAGTLLMTGGFPMKFPSFVLSFGLAMLIITLVLNLSIDPYKIGIFYRAKLYTTLDDYAKSLKDVRSSTNITFSEFGLYGSVLVKEGNNIKSLLINGKADASTGSDTITELITGYIPMMLHRNPESVALIGLGSGVTLGALENFNISRADVLEINPTVIKANTYFQKENRNALSDSRVKLVVADARNYLIASDSKYDVIISEPSNPWVEGEGFLFTKEFYQIIKNHLNSGGIFLQWIGAYDFDKEDLQTSLNTIGHVFPYYQLWAENKWLDLYIIASDKELDMDYGRIKSLFRGRISSDFKALGQMSGRQYLSNQDLLFSFYVADTSVLRDFASKGGINSDDRPVIEFNTLANRNKVINNSVIPVMQYIVSGGSSFRDLSPPLVNLSGPDGRPLGFMGLETGSLMMNLSSSKYYNRYIRHNVSLYVFQPRRMVTFREGNLSLLIYGLPRPTVPSEEEFAQIAYSLSTGINGKTEQDGSFRYKMSGDKTTGMMWYCESRKSMYIAYFTYPAGYAADQNRMDKILNGIKCQVN